MSMSWKIILFIVLFNDIGLNYLINYINKGGISWYTQKYLSLATKKIFGSLMKFSNAFRILFILNDLSLPKISVLGGIF